MCVYVFQKGNIKIKCWVSTKISGILTHLDFTVLAARKLAVSRRNMMSPGVHV